jgi:DUF1365 family protein
VVEVNNTFGERHCYLLERPVYGAGTQAPPRSFTSRRSARSAAATAFASSHRCDGLTHTVARIDHDDADGPLLQTSVSGELAPMTAASVRRALWRYPAMTFGLIVRIHWQALKLWLKRVPFVRKPKRP